MFLLYNFLLTILAPIWVPWMLWRTSRRAEKPNWKERFGDYDLEATASTKRIWLHAVSVGEVMAALPILRELRSSLPDYEVVLSVTTSSGHSTAASEASGLFNHLVYFPLDVPRFQLAAMARVRPAVVAIMETELWMNFLWAAKSLKAQTLLINGRISDRSYPRAKLLGFFYRSLLRNLDRALMQTQKDAERIQSLGARNVEVLGNCKFDQAVADLDADPTVLREEFGVPAGARVVVIGSTRSAEEEELVLEALRSPDLGDVVVIHAPRHLERAEPLANAYRNAFGHVAMRSKGETGRLMVLDTYGELGRLYALADVVVMGGGFADLGGQNLIQPLAHGKPVLHGPHMQNFAEVAAAAQQAGASIVCRTAEEVSENLKRLLEDDSERQRMSLAAQQLVQHNLGAAKRYADAIVSATSQ